MKTMLLALTCVAVVLTGPTALAQDLDIVIPIDTVVDQPGVVATQPVPAELQGATCDVIAEAENNISVRSGSNLIIASGGDSVTLLDVERDPGAVTTADEPLTLGSDISVSVELGPEGVFSGGSTVHVTCHPVASPSPSESPTPTQGPSPTETSSPTQVPSPTETSSPTVSPTTTTSDSPRTPDDETSPPTVKPETVRSAGPPRELAFTGSDAWQVAAVASVVLLAIGLGLLRAGYRRRERV